MVRSGSPSARSRAVRPRSAEAALARLVAGNRRFVDGSARFPGAHREVLARLAAGQRPYATIVGCSDSRVPPELVFDAGLGELFIIRVAGNVALPAVTGSLQYAGVHLGTPLFVVLGHEGCGAVEAALAAKLHGKREPSRIEVLLRSITPGLEGVDLRLPAEDRMRAAVEANVRWSMRQVLDSAEGRARVREGTMRLVGAVYDLRSGRVRILD